MTEIVNRNFKFKTNLSRRIFATFLDYGFFFILSYFYIDLFGHLNEHGEKEVDGILTLIMPLFWFIYFVIVEAYTGATMGHHNLNLRVQTTSRKKINIEAALKRHLLDTIDFLFLGIPAYIAICNTEKHQRLGDLWANTIVVDVKDFDQYDDSEETK